MKQVILFLNPSDKPMSQEIAEITEELAKEIGLKLEEEIGRGSFSIVYKARSTNTADQKIYAVKFQKENSASDEERVRFRKEAATLAQMQSPALVKVFAVGEFQGRSYMVMEHVEGKRLDHLLAKGQLREEQIVSFAKMLAGALQEAHTFGVVHRDIKPQNILITNENQLKLFDFGLAMQNTANAAGGSSVKDEVVGTLLYCAPEQAGVLNQPVDNRSDLYSAGAVLFECATGRPPFRSQDIGELVHQHLTAAPPRIEEINPEISRALREITYKLLAKEPDDRYQSAQGLSADLEGIRALNEGYKASAAVKLDTSSGSGKLLAETPLMGREEELARLLKQWKKAYSGKGSVVLVAGGPGIGKSRLVSELLKQAKALHPQDDVLVLSGKATLGDPLPLAAFREAIDSHLKRIRNKPEQEREAQLNRFREALGDLAPVLRNFSSQVSKLLEGQDFPADQTFSQDLFQSSLVEFLLRLTKAHGAGILLIDDVQWLDDASNEVLKRLAVSASQNKLLIAGTSRNDPDSAERLHQFIQSMKAIEALSTELNLGPLSPSAIHQLVQFQLKGGEVDATFTQQLATRSDGNPFAAMEYLRAMQQAGLLMPWWGKWLVDQVRLDSLALPTDIIQLVVSRVNDLSPKTKQVLKAAAISGSRFTTDHLPGTCSVQPEDVNQAIAEGISSRLIEREDAENYQFIHDRIREALLAELSEADLKGLYQRLAETMDQAMRSRPDHEPENEFIYALANFYAKGDIETDPGRVFAANYRAGKLAAENHADEEAYNFLERSHRFAIEYGLPLDSEFDQRMGEVCTWTFRLKDAEQFLKSAVDKSNDPIQRAQLKGQIARSLFTGWRIGAAWDEINRALEELGYPLPKSVLWNVLTTSTIWQVGEVMRWLGFRFKSSGKALKKRQVLVSLLNLASEIATFKHPLLIPAPAVRAVFHSQWLEQDADTARAYARYALLLHTFGIPGLFKTYYAKAKAIAERLRDRGLVSEFIYLEGLGYLVLGDVTTCEKIIRVVVEKYSQWTEPRRVFDLLYTLAWTHLMRGETTDSIKLCEDLIKRSKSMKNSSSVYEYYDPAFHCINLALRGKIVDAASHLEKMRATIEKLEPNPILGGDVYASLMATRYEQQDFGDGFEQIAASFQALAPNPMFSTFILKTAFIANVYSRISQLWKARSSGNAESAQAVLSKLKAAVKDLAQAAQKAPFYMPHVLAGKAAVHLAEGRSKKALKLLGEARDLANDSSNRSALFEVLRLRAMILKSLGRQAASIAEAEAAAGIAGRERWMNRMNWLRDEFGIDPTTVGGASSEGAASESRSGVTTVLGADSIQLKRHLDSLLQVSLASSGVFDPAQQLRIALDEIVRVLGADRAFVFLQDGSAGLKFAGGRSSKKDDLAEPKGYSQTVVRKVAESRQALVVTGTDEGKALGSESAVLHNLRSIMAAPLLLRDEFKGVVYLDSQLAKGIFTANDTELLSGMANHIAIAFETAKLANLEAAKRTMEKDLELSASVQSLLLPKNRVRATDEVILSGFYRPASQCGGDWWWYGTRPDGSTLVIVGDVTGHGAGPAMITASIAAHFLALHRTNPAMEISSVLSDLHQQLHQFAGGTYCMTAMAVEIDPKKKVAKFWSAGAPAAYVLPKEGAAKPIVVPGTPLGGPGEFNTGLKEVPLSAGDRVFVSSDGIPEANLSTGKVLGSKRMLQLLKDSRAMDPTESLEFIVKAVDGLRGDLSQDDDYTSVVIDVK